MWPQPKNPSYLLSPIVAGLLGTELLPRSYAPFERVSAAIAVRYLVASRPGPRALLFLLPGGSEATARCILSGLLIGSYGHENGSGRLPSEEVRRLLIGNVLFITHAPSRAIEELTDIVFGGTTPLSALWDIVPIAGSTSSTGPRQRIFVANPGWVPERILNRKFSAVVIDATHPKTQDRLFELLNIASGIAPMCVAVTPSVSQPLPGSLLRRDTCDVWFWDPVTKANAQKLVGLEKTAPPIPPTHSFLVCTEDAEADTFLKEAHALATDAARLADRREYPGLRDVRTILNRLRRLTVPLPRLEQAAAKSWYGSLAETVNGLSAIGGHGNAAWDTTWPTLRAAVENVYNAFIARKETAKFWPIAAHLDALLRKDEPLIRIVASTREECELLATDLNTVIDGVSKAVALGRLEIVTASEEARQICNGNTARTILSGPRRNDLRYLNLCPVHNIDEFVYPFEVHAEQNSIEASYKLAASFGPSRATLIAKIGLDAFSSDVTHRAFSPRVEISYADGRPIQLSEQSSMDTDISLEDLLSPSDSWQQRPLLEQGTPPQLRSGHTILVTFENGSKMPFAEGHRVDVYYSETDRLERENVENLRTGMQVVQFVDGHYDDLFFRTKEALRHRLCFRDRARLEMWDIGKERILKPDINKKALHEELCRAGLTTNYATFTTWFRDGEQVLAPQQLEEFTVLANATNLFPEQSMIAETFRCIQSVRGRNRKLGRKLHELLRALRSHSGYESALESIRSIDPDVADAYAAVRIAEVKSVGRA
jgi:hypothetical protein